MIISVSIFTIGMGGRDPGKALFELFIVLLSFSCWPLTRQLRISSKRPVSAAAASHRGDIKWV